LKSNVLKITTTTTTCLNGLKMYDFPEDLYSYNLKKGMGLNKVSAFTL
jgi:hypothetical protein